MSSKCENCNQSIIMIYGSGRFCSNKCARSFSTKNKREDINNIVSSKMGNYEIIDDKTIKEVILKSKSLREASISLKMPYMTLLRKSKKLNVFTIKKNQGSKGVYLLKAEDVLVLNNNLRNRKSGTNIKFFLFRNNLKNEICESCGIGSIWNNKKLVLELEHVNGNWKDNRIENLKILCPNCHSQTPTFRNKKRAQLE